MNVTIKDFQLGDMIARYCFVEKGGVTFGLIPAELADAVAERREFLSGVAVDGLQAKYGLIPAGYARDSLLQLKLAEDPVRDGFSGGVTLFDSPSTEALQFGAQQMTENGGRLEIQTVFCHPAGLRCIHHVVYVAGTATVDVFSKVTNEADRPVSLELLSSFVLSGITPFDQADAPGRLKLHRFRSWWGAEGRLESRTLEDLHLERPWTTHGARSERFGQVGSQPVRQFFPLVAAEDTVAGVVWGAKLAWAGSWQMEAVRRGDTLTLTGGLADVEFGHWIKTLAPGETLTSPVATLSCLHGKLDDLCQRFIKTEETRIPDVESERSLPVLFNEWCTTWGSPTQENVIATADRLMGLPVRYLVVDDGWAERPADAKMQSNGDWIVDREKFPQGLKPVGDALKERGFVPGIWFEFEVCNPGSKAWKETEHQLHRNGRILQVGSRRFWNLCDPWVREYLSEKVIGLLRDSGFRYLKVDYNDTIGRGCDHSDSLGEGLRQHILGVQEFFRKLRSELPDLIIENCSSGGHRLEPSMMQLVSMGSFSDAHEGEEIPIIAANLQRLIPPRQSQIWAVLREGDSAKRLVYSLAAGCLGRLCISGDIATLSDEQMRTVKAGLEFYETVAPVIKNGHSEFFEHRSASWNHPEGWQAVVRYSDDGTQALVVTHSFQLAEPCQALVPLVEGDWRVVRSLTHTESDAECRAGQLTLALSDSFAAQAYLLMRN